MGKVRRLVRGLGRRDFLLAAVGTFVVSLGLASAVLTIAGRHFELASSAIVIAVAALFSCSIHYRKLTARQVAADDVLDRAFFDDPATRVRCPCDFSLSAAAKRLAADCFDGHVTIEPNIFEQFRVKNPRVLACLTSRTGAFLGYFDAIPLTNERAKSLLSGTATEDEIIHEDVLDIGRMKSCEYVFISGFAVVDPDTHTGKRNASILTWALLHYLDTHYADARPLVFALAATPSGDEMLNRFRLDLRSRGEDRRDRYRLYSITLTKEAIRRRLACIPDWNGICQLDWASSDSARGSDGRPPLPQQHVWELASSGMAPRSG